MPVSFYRYPGGKSKLSKQIIQKLDSMFEDSLEYREPFFGGGSIGLDFLRTHPCSSIWINDKDPGVASLWTAVMLYPRELKERVRAFVPSIGKFDEYKTLLTTTAGPSGIRDVVDYGFMKLAIHQISYSGLGTKSGGPLGGREQKSTYKIDCRWSPDYICSKIDKLSRFFDGIEIHNDCCTSKDFSDVIKGNGESLLYVDPPYYLKGNDLYQFGFTGADHKRLANCLKNTDNPWLLSYDDCEEIRSLYENWADISVVDVNYSITATKDKKTGERKSTTKPELLISKK
jgi:DNA adenine methylase